ncbi:hypothetical protein [Curtobacterium sp. MCBA15_004]|uniref:hypothetical protein n=1 Tax=unclassified Curtobacterium TaxID=257496 RepID=UPI0008DD6BE5|nr:hypothetical protein [Curtobacterium sp. MCBA15_004]WIA96118.1 hypothetical protein QOL16_13535 [Curtobacterium sp. MCBA15_004]
MSSSYDFRLIDADLPQGEIDVDDVLQILGKLQEVAVRVGRVAADAAHRGRPSAQVERLSKLRLTGLSAGSTVIQVTRASEHSKLDFDLAEEQDFDRRFDALLSGILVNERPQDANESTAASVADLIAAFRRAAPRLEVRVDGRSRGEASTESLRADVWRPGLRETEDVVIEGWLEKVDIRSGGFRVRDAVGIAYPLPKVRSAAETSALIGRRVQVEGTAERNERGEVVAIRSAVVRPAPDHLKGAALARAIPVEEILSPEASLGTAEALALTREEQDSFLDAMGL